MLPESVAFTDFWSQGEAWTHVTGPARTEDAWPYGYQPDPSSRRRPLSPLPALLLHEAHGLFQGFEEAAQVLLEDDDRLPLEVTLTRFLALHEVEEHVAVTVLLYVEEVGPLWRGRPSGRSSGRPRSTG